jgi:hypothetical protein
VNPQRFLGPTASAWHSQKGSLRRARMTASRPSVRLRPRADSRLRVDRRFAVKAHALKFRHGSKYQAIGKFAAELG